MTEPTIQHLADAVGFELPESYNAARLLWDNLLEMPLGQPFSMIWGCGLMRR